MKLFVLSSVILAIALTSCDRSERLSTTNPAPSSQSERESASPKPGQKCINLNTATAEELTRLPGVGEVIAARIVAYREHHGRFRRPQEIIIIEGFSERKYRAIAAAICLE